jgi:hypothetical protein
METKEFTASRLSDDNKLMPNRYKINDFGITIIEPGVFKDTQKSYAFFDIETVELENPLIGFSTVKIKIEDELIAIKGLYNTDAEEMLDLIQQGIAKARMVNRNMNT